MRAWLILIICEDLLLQLLCSRLKPQAVTTAVTAMGDLPESLVMVTSSPWPPVEVRLHRFCGRKLEKPEVIDLATRFLQVMSHGNFAVFRYRSDRKILPRGFWQRVLCPVIRCTWQKNESSGQCSNSQWHNLRITPGQVPTTIPHDFKLNRRSIALLEVQGENLVG